MLEGKIRMTPFFEVQSSIITVWVAYGKKITIMQKDLVKLLLRREHMVLLSITLNKLPCDPWWFPLVWAWFVPLLKDIPPTPPLQLFKSKKSIFLNNSTLNLNPFSAHLL